MNNNKILGKRFIKSEEYLIHKAELDLKKHLWKRHKTLNEDLCDAAEDFEAAFAQRDYVDLLSVYRKQKASYASHRIKSGVCEKQIKVFKKCPNETQGWTLQQAYFQKLRMLIHDRTTKLSERVNEEIFQEATEDHHQPPRNNVRVHIEEDFESDLKSITVQRQDSEITFLVVKGSNQELQESDFEELLTKYPKKLCRALIKESFA